MEVEQLFPSQGVSLSFSGPQVGKSFGNTPIVNLILKQRLVVPGGSEMEVMAEVEHNNFNLSWIVEGTCSVHVTRVLSVDWMVQPNHGQRSIFKNSALTKAIHLYRNSQMDRLTGNYDVTYRACTMTDREGQTD